MSLSLKIFPSVQHGEKKKMRIKYFEHILSVRFTIFLLHALPVKARSIGSRVTHTNTTVRH